MGACCFCACIFKMILGVLNMVLLLLGILIAGVGGIMLSMADSQFVQELIRLIIAPVLEKELGKSFIVDNVTGNFKDLAQPISWALIIIGCILAAIAILGYLGLSLNINLCLAIYATVIGIIILVQIVIISLFFSGALNPQIDNLMKFTLHKHYGNLTDNNIYSLTWNIIMLKMECCGATGYTDFQSDMEKGNWPKEENWKVSNTTFHSMFDFPLVCCKNYEVFPTIYFNDTNCVKVNSTANNKDMGCRKKITEQIDSEIRNGLIFYIFAIIIQFIILIMVVIIMQENKVFPKGD